MLFLLRPRQTWMPYALPRDPSQQQAWNAELQQAYSSTRRVPTYDPAQSAAEPRDTVADLKDLAELHRSGALSDEEFAAAKAKALGSTDAP
jgi:hypothetical protein